MKMRKKNERKIDNIKCELDELAKMRMTHGDAIKAKNVHISSIYSTVYCTLFVTVENRGAILEHTNDIMIVIAVRWSSQKINGPWNDFYVFDLK